MRVKIKAKIKEHKGREPDLMDDMIIGSISKLRRKDYYNQSRVLNRFEPETFHRMVKEVIASIKQMATMAGKVFNEAEVSKRATLAVKKLISGYYDDLSEGDDLKNKEKRIKDELKAVKKQKELERIKKAQDKIKKLAGLK